MLSRLETMVLMGGVELPVSAIRAQIASGIDIMVHLGRLRDRSRKLLEISEIIGMENGQIQLSTLYKLKEVSKNKWIWEQKNKLLNEEKLIMAGLI